MNEGDSRATPSRGGLDRAQQRIQALVLRIAARRVEASKTQHRRSLIVAVILFVGALVFALVNFPDLPATPRGDLLLIAAVVGGPAMFALNAGEYRVSAALLGYAIPWGSAVRVTVFASAANLLPMPGSALVRIQAIRQLGAKTRKAFVATAIVGTTWVGTSAILTGFVLFSVDQPLVATAAVAVGAALMVVATASIHIQENPHGTGSTLFRLIVIEAASTIVKAGRVYLILHSLHYATGAREAMALTMAAVVSVAVGFFPAGLGLSELLSGAVSPTVGLPTAVGVLVSSIDRLLQIAMLIVVAGGLAVWIRRWAHGETDETSVPQDQQRSRL